MHAVEGPFAVRRLSTAVVLVATGLALLIAILSNVYLFQSGLFVAVIDATGGFVSGTLLANAILLGVVVYGVLHRIGGATAADLGLRRSHVLPAVVVTFGIWLLLNGVQAAVSWATAGEVVVSPWLVEHARGRAVELVGQLFGNALFEEVMFRGCLLAQIAWWLTPRDRALQRREVVLATVWSQAWFALQHVPNRLAFDAWDGVADVAGDLAMLWIAGVCFAAIWLRTKNLLVAVGYHALGNCPFLVLAGPGWVHPATMFALMLVLVGFGPRLHEMRSGGARGPVDRATDA